MSTTYTFNGVAAQEAAEYMQSASRNLQTLVDDMNSTLTSSLLEWDDSAKDTYTQAQTQWNASATYMWNALAKAQEALVSIGDGYDQATRAGVQAFS